MSLFSVLIRDEGEELQAEELDSDVKIDIWYEDPTVDPLRCRPLDPS